MNPHITGSGGFHSSLGLLGMVLCSALGTPVGVFIAYGMAERGISFRRMDDLRVGIVALLIGAVPLAVLRIISGLAFNVAFRVGEYWPTVWLVVTAAAVSGGYRWTIQHRHLPEE